MFNLNSNNNSNSNSNHSIEIINNKDSVSKYPNWRLNYLANNNYINNINEQIVEYYKLNILYPDLQAYFLNDSFYGEINKIIELDLSANDSYIFNIIRNRSFSSSFKEITNLYDQNLIGINDYNKYMYKLLSTALKQSSKLNLILNGFLNDTDNYFVLDNLLDGELIYLNGEYTYIRLLDDNFYCMDFKGFNNYTVLKNLENLRNAYKSLNDNSYNFKMCDELLIKLKANFLNVYGFEYSYENYKRAMLDDYDNCELFESYKDGINNLIFQNKLDVFWFKYYYNGELKEKVIQADSLFKLRFWIYNEQNNPIEDFKKICNYRDIKFELVNNQILPKNILDLIDQINKEYDTL